MAHLSQISSMAVLVTQSCSLKITQSQKILLIKTQHSKRPMTMSFVFKSLQSLPAESGAGELAECVPEHLEPLPAHVEEDGAVRLALLRLARAI